MAATTDGAHTTVAVTTPRPRPRPGPSTGFRPDVQGLRALAVGFVVVYHLYPSLVPGGFVGVDVFFVISGFLITAHLAGGLARHGRVRLLDFYGRRARRLLPAAALVLAVTWLASKWLLPVTQLPATAEQVRASALYFQNWVLARDSVDYLAQQNQPSPVQHFWSLSVEEQFYLVWPLIFVAAAALLVPRSAGRHRQVSADRGRAARSVVALLAVAVTGASLWYSVTETAADPQAAYFVTPTRMWELAAGGLVALLPTAFARRVASSGVLGWAGLLIIVGSAFVLSSADAFPGWVALAPVGGAVLLLGAGSASGRLGPARLTSSRPFVFVGDISYSLYLWHWPVIVLWRAYSGRDIGVLDGVVIIVAALVLSWLTKIAVEDPFRRARIVTRRPAYSLATVATVLVPVLLVAFTAPVATPPSRTSVDAAHPGAAAISAPASATPSDGEYLPPLIDVPKDLPLATVRQCQADTYETKVGQCTFGDTTAPQRTVVLIGDSHAGQWSSALDAIGKQRHWKFVGIMHVACRWTATMTELDGKPFTACHDWGAAALRVVTRLRPDTVLMAERPNRGTPEHPEPDATSWRQIGEGMAEYATRVTRAGSKVVGIQETPEPERNVPDCLASRTGSIASCGRPASKAVLRDTPMDVAAEIMGSQLPVVDMNDLLCTATVCPPVIGNVVVYRDEQHLAKTYTLSLRSELGHRLAATDAFV